LELKIRHYYLYKRRLRFWDLCKNINSFRAPQKG